MTDAEDWKKERHDLANRLQRATNRLEIATNLLRYLERNRFNGLCPMCTKAGDHYDMCLLAAFLAEIDA